MISRRKFFAQATAACSIFSVVPTLAGGTQNSGARTLTNGRSPRPLRVLVLGGTGYIGPHIVQAAVSRGHEVSVFNRGKTRTELPSAVEHLVGDRNGDLKSITGREWDAVFDLAVYVPKWVRTVGDAIRNRVKHYTFISSVDVYDYSIPNASHYDESSKVKEYKESADPFGFSSLPDSGNYSGVFKRVSEGEAVKQFPNRTLIVRPGTLIGPRDNTERFTYWVARIDKGGEVLAPGFPGDPHQNLDVRDFAQWIVSMAERRMTGIYNAVGLDSTIGATLGSVIRASASHASLEWARSDWLLEEQRRGTDLFLPLWFAGSDIGSRIMRLAGDKARTAGLTYRSIAVSALDTLQWYKSQSADAQMGMVTGFDSDKGIPTRTSWDVLMAREEQVIARWRVHQAGLKQTPNS